MTKDLRNKVYNKFNGHCAYCGIEITMSNMQVDHIIPKFLYSAKHDCLVVHGRKVEGIKTNELQNLNPTCRICNNWKHTWTVEEFRHEIELQITRLRNYSASFRLAEKYDLLSINKNPIIFYFEKQVNSEIN